MVATRTRYIQTLDQLDAIEPIWRELAATGDSPSLFQSWEWNRTWCERFLADGKSGSLDTRLVESPDGRPLGILPFFKLRLLGPMLELTQFLGHRLSYHNDILLAEPKSAEIAAEIVRSLVAEAGPRAIVHLRHLEGDSPFTRELVRLGLAENQCTRLKVERDPESPDPSSRFGKSTRKRHRGQVNKLNRELGIDFQVRSGEALLDAMEVLVDLHQRRFASQQRETQFAGDNLGFRKEVMTKFPSGVFEILELRAGEKIIASTLMAHDGDRYFCIQTGFDPEFSSYSPMRILLTEAIRRGFEDLRCSSFDLGPGYESYKYDWKPTVGANFFCCIGGRGLYAKAMAALYRVAFRRSLPRASNTRSD